LYWKKGTTVAAYVSVIFGAVLGVAGLIYPSIYKNQFHREFPINSQWLYFIGMCSASVVYIVISHEMDSLPEPACQNPEIKGDK
jgi:cytosine/uracil/thiamine/allantoin permease